VTEAQATELIEAVKLVAHAIAGVGIALTTVLLTISLSLGPKR
jgi:hypothetical protein